jgi:DNA repair protein RadC
MTTATIQNLFAVNEVEVVYRNKVPRENRLKVQRAEQAYDIFYQSWDMNKIDLLEEFKILMVDVSCACLGLANISVGGITGCVADPRLIFALAIKCRATGIILAHNHPSGSLSPSNADMMLTQRVVDGGRLFDIKVIDHLILGNHQYFSMSDEGVLPSPRW